MHASVVFIDREIAVEAFPTTRRSKLLDQRFHVVDRSGVALGGEPCAAFAVHSFELGISVVEGGDEMRGCVPGFARRQFASFQNHHAPAVACQAFRDQQARDASTNDADVAEFIVQQRRLIRNLGIQPDGLVWFWSGWFHRSLSLDRSLTSGVIRQEWVRHCGGR